MAATPPARPRSTPHARRPARRHAALAGAALFLGALLLPAAPAAAQVAVISVTAPVAETSEAGLRAAALAAFERAVQGAEAMGLGEVRILSIELVEASVLVHVLASDRMFAAAPPDGSPRGRPSPEPGADASPGAGR